MKMTVNTENVERWGLSEIVLRGSTDGNPFLDGELLAQFTHGQRTIEVGGFFDGDGIYRVRFMPDEQGEWSFHTCPGYLFHPPANLDF
jgi:hypothetical protein